MTNKEIMVAAVIAALLLLIGLLTGYWVGTEDCKPFLTHPTSIERSA